MDSGILTNAQRAGFAKRAVDAFRQVTRTDDEDALSDLLCDLMHLYGGETFDREADRARFHYDAELREEAALQPTSASSPSPAAAGSENSPIRYICGTCGSDDLLFDAWASWDEERQQMELSSTLDMTYCNKCEGETRTNTVPIATAATTSP